MLYTYTYTVISTSKKTYSRLLTSRVQVYIHAPRRYPRAHKRHSHSPHFLVFVNRTIAARAQSAQHSFIAAAPHLAPRPRRLPSLHLPWSGEDCYPLQLLHTIQQPKASSSRSTSPPSWPQPPILWSFLRPRRFVVSHRRPTRTLAPRSPHSKARPVTLLTSVTCLEECVGLLLETAVSLYTDQDVGLL